MSGISRAECLSLWENQAALPELDPNLRETHGRVGKYLVLWDLGQGEFGKVRACVVDKNADAKAKDGEYALKSINEYITYWGRKDHTLRVDGEPADSVSVSAS